MKGEIPYTGLCLVLGSIIGVLVFEITGRPLYIGAGAGIGAMVGTIVQSMVGRGKRFLS